VEIGSAAAVYDAAAVCDAAAARGSEIAAREHCAAAVGGVYAAAAAIPPHCVAVLV